MKSIYTCKYCNREQIIGTEKEEIRELKKNSSNLEVLYREEAKDLNYKGWKIKEFFKDLTEDIKAKYGAEVDKELLREYFKEVELGAEAIIAFNEWIRSNGGYENTRENTIVLP